MCMLIWDEIGMRCYPFVSLQFMQKLVADGARPCEFSNVGGLYFWAVPEQRLCSVNAYADYIDLKLGGVAAKL